MDFGEQVAQKRQALKDKQTEDNVKFQQKLDYAKTADASAKVAIASAKAIIKSLSIHEPKVEVKNFPELASAKDAKQLVANLDDLTRVIKSGNTDVTRALQAVFKNLSQNLSTIPSKFSSEAIIRSIDGLNKELVKLNNRKEPTNDDVVRAAKKIEEAVSKLKLDPKIDVKPPQVKVEPARVDLSGVAKSVANLEKAIKAIKLPTTDMTEVINASNATATAIKNLHFPVPNYVLPYRDVSGKATQVQLESDGSIPVTPQGSLIAGTDYDYIDVQQTSATVETFVYKTGGSGGTTVRTIVVTYTDSTKNDLDKVEWS